MLRYAMTGGLAAMFALLTSVLSFRYAHINSLVSQAFGFLVGTGVNYPLSRIWAFKNRSKKIPQQLGFFVMVTGIGFLINELSLFISTFVVHLWTPFGMVIGLGAAFVWNFSANDALTFGKAFR